MSTATDQLVLRKNIPKNMAIKPPIMFSLASWTAKTRSGMLMRRLMPQMKGSIHSNFGLS
jgi:hypothetical protein